MKYIRKHLKFFFQTERIHPIHVFALMCFLVSMITLPLEIVFSIVNRNYFNLILKSLLLVSFIVVFIGSYQAYQKSQETDSQDS